MLKKCCLILWRIFQVDFLWGHTTPKNQDWAETSNFSLLNNGADDYRWNKLNTVSKLRNFTLTILFEKITWNLCTYLLFHRRSNKRVFNLTKWFFQVRVIFVFFHTVIKQHERIFYYCQWWRRSVFLAWQPKQLPWWCWTKSP